MDATRRDLIRRFEIEVVIDVGANSGQWASARRLDGYRGRIVSFEPLAEAFAALENAASADERWDVRNVALGRAPGDATIFVSRNSYSSSLLPIEAACVDAAPEAAYEGDQQITIATLDDEIGPVESPVLIKIDTQGTEASVLKGAAETLRHAAAVEVELSLSPLYEGQSDPAEICSMLAAHGLVLHDVEREFWHPETGELLQINALFGRPLTRATASSAAARGHEVAPPSSIDPCTDFHSPEYLRHNQRRLEHLATLGLEIAGRTVLEVGAGIGDHTEFFLDRGCAVSISDARPENVALLEKRFPHASVRLLDLDDPDPGFDEQADIVYCYGILYHLGAPEAALRFLAERTLTMMLVETCVSFGDADELNPVDEPADQPSQAFHGRGCRPTRVWVRERLRELFPHVYMPVTQPSHPEFPLDWTKAQPAGVLSRAIYVAARAPLVNDRLSLGIPERQTHA